MPKPDNSELLAIDGQQVRISKPPTSSTSRSPSSSPSSTSSATFWPWPPGALNGIQNPHPRRELRAQLNGLPVAPVERDAPPAGGRHAPDA